MNSDLKNKIFQMFIMGLDGDNLAQNPNLETALQEGLGGVIFFTQNIKSKEQIKNLTAEIKSIAKIPPFLSIDEEGGRVERTENLFGGKKFLSAKFAAQKGENFLTEQTVQISRLLKDLGFNLNFAPCLDVNTNPQNPIIGERAFSDKTDEVIKFGEIVVQTYLNNGIIPCTKHFPGHGDASVDSHLSLPVMDMPLDKMEELHIKPFEEVFSPMIMVAHLHCKAFDEEKIPSSLSKNVINYLRNNINFKGLIITDDMVMGGVSSFDATENCIKAIKAGVNILLYRDSHDETLQIVQNITETALVDEKLAKNIEISYEKILELKNQFKYVT